MTTASSTLRTAALRDSIIRELFVRSADENYITARWCATSNMIFDFLWLSLHALEKYMKAALLSNGRSSKGYGHNIGRLYKEIRSISGELIPETMSCPKFTSKQKWKNCNINDYLETVERYGNPDSRYGIYGYCADLNDLYKLDRTIFLVRRIICDLDNNFLPENTDIQCTNREILTRNPTWFPSLRMPLDELIRLKDEDNPTRHVALNLNEPFAPHDYVHSTRTHFTSILNPVILRAVLEPLESTNPSTVAIGVETAEWLLANVKLPRGGSDGPGVIEQIEAALEDAQARCNLP